MKTDSSEKIGISRKCVIQHLIILFAFLALFVSPKSGFAEEIKRGEKEDGKNQTRIKLKIEGLNLNKEMRKAMESLLPEGFRIQEYYNSEGDKYYYLINAPKNGNREHLVSVLDFIDKLENSSYSAFMSVCQVGIFGRDNSEDHKILLTLQCRVKTGKKENEPHLMKLEERSGLLYDCIREIYLIKPTYIEALYFRIPDSTAEFYCDFISHQQDENIGPLAAVSDLFRVLNNSKYVTDVKLRPKGDRFEDRDQYSGGISCHLPNYSSPFTSTERESLLNSILKTTPPIFNLSKVRFNKASKGFIIEISPQSKDKAAILKSITVFLKEFSRLKGSEQLFFDRLVIHLSKDKTGVERMFIEMMQCPEVTPGGEMKPVYPDSKEYGEYRDSKVKDLESVVSKNPVNIFSDGYSHTDDTGKFSILTIRGE